MKASSFDSLYKNEEQFIQRLIRPVLFRRLEAAVQLVRQYKEPRILDVGCGSGRVAEYLIDAGVGEYIGVDFSAPMIKLAHERLQRFGSNVTLITGDFINTELVGTFDIIVALGFFDYIEKPWLFARRMYELCTGTVIASFPKWDLLKGPIRYLRYEVLNDCTIFNYTERELEFLFLGAGFSSVSTESHRAGIMMKAYKNT